MPTIKSVNLKGILVLAGVAVITAAIGFATTVQLSARNTQGGGAGPGRPGRRAGSGHDGTRHDGPRRARHARRPGRRARRDVRPRAARPRTDRRPARAGEGHHGVAPRGPEGEREKMMTARKALHDAIAADRVRRSRHQSGGRRRRGTRCRRGRAAGQDPRGDVRHPDARAGEEGEGAAHRDGEPDEGRPRPRTRDAPAPDAAAGAARRGRHQLPETV